MLPISSRNCLILIASLLAIVALPEGVGSAVNPPSQQANDALVGAKRKSPYSHRGHVHAVYRYRVDRRHPAWGVAAFPNQSSAHTFASQMHRKHFQTHTVHSGKTWQVRYAMAHWHRGRPTLNPIFAQQTSLALQRQGYQTRVVRHLHRVF